ncbi:MAG: hypothetical protein OXU70_13500 [Gammaproteobacteria bacterium]|nr:hypothetical protein [Gammaproteobacteria bacterium]
MATYKRRKVENALVRKGFRRKEGHHSFFHYHTEAGEKTPVWTKTSHGRSGADIHERLFKRMADQCGLTADEFGDLVECPMSRTDYEQRLRDLGKV